MSDNTSAYPPIKLSLFHPANSTPVSSQYQYMQPSYACVESPSQAVGTYSAGVDSDDQQDDADQSNENFSKSSKVNQSKSCGRWTTEEHQKFLEGLKLFNRNWKKVEKHIGTRSGAQIRSHAQKYFCRIEKDSKDTLINADLTKTPPSHAQTPTSMTLKPNAINQPDTKPTPTVKAAISSNDYLKIPPYPQNQQPNYPVFYPQPPTASATDFISQNSVPAVTSFLMQQANARMNNYHVKPSTHSSTSPNSWSSSTQPIAVRTNPVPQIHEYLENYQSAASTNHNNQQQSHRYLFEEKDSEDPVSDKYQRPIQDSLLQDNSFFFDHLADIPSPRLYDICAMTQPPIPGNSNTGQYNDDLAYKTEVYLPKKQRGGRSRFGSFKLHDEDSEESNQRYQKFRKASIDDQELKKKFKLNDASVFKPQQEPVFDIVDSL